MKRMLPSWYAQPRGTSITAFGEPGGEEPRRSFLPELAYRLTHIVDGGPAAVIGFVVVLAMLLSLPAAGAAVSPATLVTLALVPLAWCGIGAWAGLAIYNRRDGAPAWVRGLVDFLVIVGKTAAFVFVVGSFVGLVLLVAVALGSIAAIGKDRR